MPVVALVLLGVFAVLGFGWRSREQRRRTRSTGFRGISGRLGSAEWFAGVGFVVPLVVAVGIVATVYAQPDMGDSWRIGMDPAEATTLVRTGVFGRVRNPILTAMMTSGLGTALVTPNLVAIAGFVLLVVTIELQVRVDEEPYLTRVHGEAYRGYLATVGRFVPDVGVRRPARSA